MLESGTRWVWKQGQGEVTASCSLALSDTRLICSGFIEYTSVPVSGDSPQLHCQKVDWKWNGGEGDVWMGGGDAFSSSKSHKARVWAIYSLKTKASSTNFLNCRCIIPLTSLIFSILTFRSDVSRCTAGVKQRWREFLFPSWRYFPPTACGKWFIPLTSQSPVKNDR